MVGVVQRVVDNPHLDKVKVVVEHLQHRVVEQPKVVEHQKEQLVDKKIQQPHPVVNLNHHPKVVVVEVENKRVSKKRWVGVL
jgi:hypothetical protein